MSGEDMTRARAKVDGKSTLLFLRLLKQRNSCTAHYDFCRSCIVPDLLRKGQEQ
jgi:hypothetical protein